MSMRGVLVLGLLLVVGCGGDSPPTDPPGDPAAAPGATPRATAEALIGCVERDRLVEVWNLLSEEARRDFTESIGKMLLRAREVPEAARRKIESPLGMTIEEFAALPGPEALAAYLTTEAVIMPGVTPLAVLRGAQYESENLDRDRCTVRLTPVDQETAVPVRLVLQGEVWVLPEWQRMLSPGAGATRERLECMNNLRQIGGLLMLAKTSGKDITRYSGPAFLLQVAARIDDDDLKVFICPGEPEDAAPDRPPVGSPEFVKMYRDLDLDKEQDWSKYTSYAGPDWKSHPQNPHSSESRIWVCDRCAGGKPHHDGIVVLWDSSRVTFVKMDEIARKDGGEDTIQVGPESSDRRLRTMLFNSDD